MKKTYYFFSGSTRVRYVSLRWYPPKIRAGSVAMVTINTERF